MKKTIFFVLSVLCLASCAYTFAPEIPEVRLKPGEFGMQINKPSPVIACIAYSPQNRYVAIGKVSGELILWDVTEGRMVWSVIAIPKDEVSGGHGKVWEFIAVFFSPDGSRVYSASGFGMIRAWDVESGKLLSSFRVTQKDEGLWSVTITRDGKRMLVGGAVGWADGFLRLWDVEKGTIIREFSIQKYRGVGGASMHVTSTDISLDGKLALATYGYYIPVWNLETGEELKKIKLCMPTNAVFSPDGKRIVTEACRKINVMDVETGRVLQRFGDSPEDPVLSADGKKILFSDTSLFKIWDIETAREVRIFEGKTPFFYSSLFLWSGAKFSPNGKRMVSFSRDASIRVWDVESGEELMVMTAFEDGEWLAITSEGYYNASTNGHKYLNVMMGENKYTAEAFYDVFYRPDIVAAKLRGEDIKDLITITMKDAIKNPPPVVEISPIASTINEPKAKVCYNIKNTGGGIGEVRLFHNGKLIESDGFYKEVAKTSDKMPLASLTSKTIYEDMRSVKIKEKADISQITTKPKREAFNDCKEIDAISGENEISITAFNKGNTVQGYMQTAKFTSTIKPEEPHLYILSIGIDQYKDSSVNLKYAVKDARDMQEKLIKQSATLYKPENIHHEIITDKDATKTNILNKVEWFAQKIKPTDSFILFAAGHGVLLQNQYYMLTHEYDGAISDNILISANEIVEMSKKVKSLSQLLIFDTCYAGGVDYIVSGLYDARMSVLAKKMGLHIYASASSLQEAIDGYQGNGLFTYILLDGLNNKKEADKNSDRKVSLTELGEYTKTTTSETSKQIGHPQTPLIINFGKDNAVYNLQ